MASAREGFVFIFLENSLCPQLVIWRLEVGTQWLNRHIGCVIGNSYPKALLIIIMKLVLEVPFLAFFSQQKAVKLYLLLLPCLSLRPCTGDSSRTTQQSSMIYRKGDFFILKHSYDFKFYLNSGNNNGYFTCIAVRIRSLISYPRNRLRRSL
jgi:hypothetical protein